VLRRQDLVFVFCALASSPLWRAVPAFVMELTLVRMQLRFFHESPSPRSSRDRRNDAQTKRNAVGISTEKYDPLPRNDRPRCTVLESSTCEFHDSELALTHLHYISTIYHGKVIQGQARRLLPSRQRARLARAICIQAIAIGRGVQPV